MVSIELCDDILARALSLQDKMNKKDKGDFVRLSKEYAALSPLMDKASHYKKIHQEIKDLEEWLESDDEEMRQVAQSELPSSRQTLKEIKRDLEILLLPKDKQDDLDVILEIRAGTGGEEASLFAGALFRMYAKFCETQNWQIEVLSQSEASLGGYKELVASIAGQNVFAKMKFESGVHRVQRIPATEHSGRIHTSAATVAVLPEPKEIDVVIEEKELRVDVFRASGPGGQSVNTTDSAVRITHLPTGIMVTQQDEKSQHKNRAKAMQVLRARLFDRKRKDEEEKRSLNRKMQIGSGDRSQRIRTYNFPQGRVTDHRINLTLHKLDKIMAGELEELLQALTQEALAEKLALERNADKQDKQTKI